jgi:hypothetical protein
VCKGVLQPFPLQYAVPTGCRHAAASHAGAGRIDQSTCVVSQSRVMAVFRNGGPFPLLAVSGEQVRPRPSCRKSSVFVRNDVFDFGHVSGLKNLTWCRKDFLLRKRCHFITQCFRIDHFGRTLRTLVDRNAAPARSAPREERELFIAAGNGHLLTCDNLSDIRPGSPESRAARDLDWRLRPDPMPGKSVKLKKLCGPRHDVYRRVKLGGN